MLALANIVTLIHDTKNIKMRLALLEGSHFMFIFATQLMIILTCFTALRKVRNLIWHNLEKLFVTQELIKMFN